MASYSGFLRKAPSGRLKAYFAAKIIGMPEEFNWISAGRGTAFVSDLNAVINDLPAAQQDRLKAELDHLASLANDATMVSAEQVCPMMGIDLEGFEGVQDVLLMLALDYPKAFERVAVQTSLNRRTGGKNWSAFQFDDDGQAWALEDDIVRTAFVTDAIGILNLPAHRKREADWYRAVRIHPITGQETEIVQATIYVEDRAASELTFGPSEGLERKVFQRVLELGIACKPTERIVEICAAGGKKVRDEYAQAFSKHFAPGSEPPIEAPRRDLLLNTLRSNPAFPVEPADGVEGVEVSSLDFFSTGGGIARFEKRGDGETIYQFLDGRFGQVSPLKAGGWQIVAATLRIVMAAQDGKRRRTLTVTLRSPNTTTIPNKTEADYQLAINLLERWNLIAPPSPELDVIEDY
ncbi:hypothetical protein [uncultured Tateyamaria sp.]|uniref:hypothetical protein n=1 Tax=uncultured Tateyamaria sp. TaxID=455651 RepID=UPI0026066151|nr:hypothetical protein [uncultured Tateyamaria sp.]